MIKKTISALFFSLFTLAGIGCWDFGFEESQYVSPFDENILVAPDLMPFLFSAHDFHWSFDSLSDGNLPTSEDRWAQHFNHQYSKKELQQLVNDWSEEDFQLGLKSKADTFNNALLTDFRKGKHTLERQYLELAHQSTSLKQRDEWANFFSWWEISYKIETEEDVPSTEDTAAAATDGSENGINTIGLERERKKEAEAARLQDSLSSSRGKSREKLILQFEKLRSKTNNKELLERINYQILVLNYYQPMGGDFEKLFQKIYPQPQPQSIFYWMACDHYAGTPQREMQEDNAMDWVRIFLHAPSLRKGAMASFPEQDDESWEGLMNCTQNKEEKVGLWLMLAFQQPEITAYAFEKAFQISEKSPSTDLLMVREIQLLESQFHLHENRLETYPYTMGITYEYEGLEVKQQIKELVFRWNQLFRKHENHLTETQHLGWAYLQHLAGNEDDALKTLQNFHPKNEDIQRSKKVFQLLVRQQISYLDGWNDSQDAQTVKDLEWFSQFPGFDRIANKKGWTNADWDNSDGKIDMNYDGRIFESHDTYRYAAMRDGMRTYLHEYMRHRSEEADAFATPSAPKSLAMWFLSPLFNVYDYPENWDAAGILELMQNPENQSKTDRWFFNHLPKSVEQTTYIKKGDEWGDTTFSIPINSDFWNEIAGELALQKRDHAAAFQCFKAIQNPKQFPRLQLESNPLSLPSIDVSRWAKTTFQIPSITNKIVLAEALYLLSQRSKTTEMTEKSALATWMLGILEFNISYAGNSWEASRFAWSYNDPDAFQSDVYWRKKNLPDENYFDCNHPKQLIYKAYQYFQSQKKGKEFAAGCAISLLQLNTDGTPSYWSNSPNADASQQSAILIDWLQTKFSKTKTFRTFEKKCPEYEVYALTNWD
jgi:hypothetical protein